jgi:hypothetical protein
MLLTGKVDKKSPLRPQMLDAWTAQVDAESRRMAWAHAAGDSDAELDAFGRLAQLLEVAEMCAAGEVSS